MKNLFKLVLMLAVVLWASDAFSQTEAGKFYFGGSSNLMAAFGTTKYKYEPTSGDNVEYDGPKTTAFNVSPSIGYFIINGFSAGIFLDYTYSKSEQDENDYKSKSTSTYNSLVFGPFAKFYFGDGNIKPFVMGSVGFGNMKTTYEGDDTYMKSSDSETEFKLFKWQAGAGLAFFASESVSFELGVGYESEKYTDEQETGDYHQTDSGIGVRFGIGIFLGQ